MDWGIVAAELRTITKGKVRIKEPLKYHTTFRIGGPADLFVIPASVLEIPLLLSFAGEKGLPTTVLGNGSNVLVKDGGISGLVIKMGGGPKGVEVRDECLAAEAGVLMPRLAREAYAHGLSGLEFMIGIPGTVGGGVMMNAGAHGQSMNQVVTKVEAIGADGLSRVLPVDALQLGYRQSTLKNSSALITRVYLQLSFKQKALIRKKMKHNMQVRRRGQPWQWPSAGSVFVNPQEQAAGYLLEAAGMKGVSRGGAEVAHEHANFIINKGGATAADVMQLIEEMKTKVAEKFGVQLQREIQFLGEEL